MSLALMQPEALAIGPRLRSTAGNRSSSCNEDARLSSRKGFVAENGQNGSSGPVPFMHSSHSHTQLHNELPQPRPIQMLRASHTRSRSATTSPTPSPLSAPPLREGAVSTTERSSTARPCSPHHFLTLPRGMIPRASPVSAVETETDETIGAFSPTSCPRRHLHLLLGTLPKSRKRKAERLRLDFDFAPDVQSQQESSDRSPPLSPIPSICRTPSSYSESEYFSTAPSSAGPTTPVHSNSTSPILPHKALRPILEALEDASKFRVQTSCASCGKAGSNFPCCPRCSEMWCSRECRLRSTGGKKHICKKSA